MKNKKTRFCMPHCQKLSQEEKFANFRQINTLMSRNQSLIKVRLNAFETAKQFG